MAGDFGVRVRLLADHGRVGGRDRAHDQEEGQRHQGERQMAQAGARVPEGDEGAARQAVTSQTRATRASRE